MKKFQIVYLLVTCFTLACSPSSISDVNSETKSFTSANGSKSYISKEEFKTVEAEQLTNEGLEAASKHDGEEALSLFHEALSIEPDNKTILNNIGLIFCQINVLDSAETYLLQSLEQDPNYYNSRINLGLLYQQQNRYDESLEMNSFVINNCSDGVKLASTFYNNGLTYYHLGDWENALSNFQESKILCDELEMNSSHVIKAISTVEKKIAEDTF